MKIHDAGRIGALQQYRKAQSGQAGKAGRPQEKDEVQISSQAKQLQGTQHESGIQHAERLERLRESVHNGTYKVDAHQIAEKMLPYFMPGKGE